MLGLELVDARAIAVRIDDRGAIEARAVVAAGGDLAWAAERAVAGVVAAGHGARERGIAAALPEAPAITAAAAALASRVGGAFAQHGITPSGTAAAVAEAWIGAARGVHDVVFFACGDHTIGGVVRAGAPVSGARGRAASVAWVSLNPVEREDYRKAGCLEAEGSPAGIERRLVWRIKAGDRSRVLDAAGGDLPPRTIAPGPSRAPTRHGVSISVQADTPKYLVMSAAHL